MFEWLKRLIGGGGKGGVGGGDYGRLVRLARGDSERADRLIDYELKRDPSLSRAGAIQSAIDRLEYDRTR